MSRRRMIGRGVGSDFGSQHCAGRVIGLRQRLCGTGRVHRFLGRKAVSPTRRGTWASAIGCDDVRISSMRAPGTPSRCMRTGSRCRAITDHRRGQAVAHFGDHARRDILLRKHARSASPAATAATTPASSASRRIISGKERCGRLVAERARFPLIGDFHGGPRRWMRGRGIMSAKPGKLLPIIPDSSTGPRRSAAERP